MLILYSVEQFLILYELQLWNRAIDCNVIIYYLLFEGHKDIERLEIPLINFGLATAINEKHLKSDYIVKVLTMIITMNHTGFLFLTPFLFIT